MRRGDRSFLDSGPLFFVPRLAYMLAGFTTLVIPDDALAIVVLSFIVMAWATTTMQRRGGPYLTPSGVIALSAGVFVGVAPLYLVSGGAETPLPDLHFAIIVAFVTTVATEAVAAIFCIRWQVEWRVLDRSEARRLGYRPPRQFLVKGLALLAVSQVPMIGAFNYEVGRALGMVGAFMVVLTAVALGRRTTWGGDLLLVIVGVLIPVLWAQQVFRGGGRLVLAGVGIAVLMMWNLVRPSGWQKVVVVAMVPVFMVFAGFNRLDNIEREWGVVTDADTGSVLGSGQGLESVYDPLDIYATLLHTDEYDTGGTLGPRYGATFVNTLLMPIPRSSWEGKPDGFGRELVQLTRPDLLRHGQSFAALIHTEFYANFGWAGLFMLPLALGWVVARLDRLHADVANSQLAHDVDWWRLLILSCAVASLGDLYWGGTFTFYSRGGLAVIVALLLRVGSRRSGYLSEGTPVAVPERRGKVKARQPALANSTTWR